MPVDQVPGLEPALEDPLCRESQNRDATWTRADLDRLIAGDNAMWGRALAVIERAVASLMEEWNLGTLEAEAVRDHVVDILLADGRCRLRDVRDPAKFAGYLKAIARNRAYYVAQHRITVIPLKEVAVRVTALVDVRAPSVPPLLADSLPRIALGRTLASFRDTLTERQFLVLWLYHVQGQSMTRIAKALRITQQAVSKTHAAALSALHSVRRHGIAEQSPEPS